VRAQTPRPEPSTPESPEPSESSQISTAEPWVIPCPSRAAFLAEPAHGTSVPSAVPWHGIAHHPRGNPDERPLCP
jgi:hypothetical protein